MNDGTMTKSTTMAPANGATDKSGSMNDATKDFATKGKEKLEAVKETVLDVKEKVLDAKDKVVETGTAGIDKVRSFAVANPLKTIAIAFGVGYIGMRITRMFR